MNDPAVLRKRIAELEQENKRLKESDPGKGGAAQGGGFSTMRSGNGAGTNQDKDWMNFG